MAILQIFLAGIAIVIADLFILEMSFGFTSGRVVSGDGDTAIDALSMSPE